jgi:hypothetical protein
MYEACLHIIKVFHIISYKDPNLFIHNDFSLADPALTYIGAPIQMRDVI